MGDITFRTLNVPCQRQVLFILISYKMKALCVAYKLCAMLKVLVYQTQQYACVCLFVWVRRSERVARRLVTAMKTFEFKAERIKTKQATVNLDIKSLGC
jgi:hypothetical protein